MRTGQQTFLSLVVALCAGAATAQDAKFIRNEVLGAMKWRALGPAAFGGRIVDFAVHPKKPRIYYAATASGGVYKTENNGTNFRALFQFETAVSIGDIALAPSNPDVLYIGTGEANNQRSSYWGDGIYKSTNGGKTWALSGLAGTDHIGRIVVDPEDPNLVYVAALGALYSANDERGIYRSIDGGKSWARVKFISPDVGFVDLVMDPHDSKTLYAASYERRRRAWNFDASGPGSAVYKSSDGGNSWTKLGGGLPRGEIGRIGLDVFAGAENTIVFATVENRNPARRSARSNGGRPGRPRIIGGEVYRSADGGKTWQKINDKPIGGSPAYYYGQIRVDPTDEKRIYVLSSPLHATTDGGKTWHRADRGVHIDHHALWIDPRNPRHLLLGNDGGMHVSYDYGAHWDHHDHLSMGQFYAITADLSDPYWIYGGTQDNGSWGIPSRGTAGAVQNRHAVKISGGDGFFVQVDPLDKAIVYSEMQFGRIVRQNLRTGARKSIRPTAQRGSPRLRFNWCAPIRLSPHNHHTVYFGSQFLHRSTNRGDSWTTISPDLSTNDEAKIEGNVPHCTITTISESPKKEGLLWVGTDDGSVWVTRNTGERWVELTDRFDGLPARLWVSRVEASPSDADVAYVAFTGYREDIRDPYVYLTTDGGETFRSISNNLPREPINVIREHPRNKDVLFVGTEFGVFVSVDSGAHWHTLQGDMPTVACHDLMVHPRENDLIVGTHGRGIYVMDITPLTELNESVLGSNFHVFSATDGFVAGRGRDRGYIGNRSWSADRKNSGAVFSYFLGANTDEAVTIRVFDAKGTRLFNQSGPKTAGLHRVTWQIGRGRRRGGRGGGFQRGLENLARRFAGGGSTGPGDYVVEVSHGKTVVRKLFKIRP